MTETHDLRNCNTLESLSYAYQEWREDKGYIQLSADELLDDLVCRPGAVKEDVQWLKEFLSRWDEVEEREGKPTIAVQNHWAKELSKIRCWIAGFKAGRGTSDSFNMIPGEDVLRQIEIAIKDAMK